MPNGKEPPAIVITGSSTGIGQACALGLDARGFRVFAGVRSQADGQRLQEQASARLRPVLIDVTDEASIAAGAEIVRDAVGEAGLAGLLNNAGIAVAGPIELLPLAQFRRQLEVNVIGQIAVTQAFLPMLRQARGRIVNISSVDGAIAPPYLGAYSASKFALEAISDALRVELRQWGIQVSIIEPGAIATPIWKKSRTLADELAAQTPPEAVAMYQADLEAMQATTERLSARAVPVDRVVRAAIHAFTAKRPKTRYFLGIDVRFMFKGFHMVPDRLRDWIMRRAIGLS